MCSSSRLIKNRFFVTYVKKTKFDTKIMLFMWHSFFLQRPRKVSIFRENYEDISVKIYFRICQKWISPTHCSKRRNICSFQRKGAIPAPKERIQRRREKIQKPHDELIIRTSLTISGPPIRWRSCRHQRLCTGSARPMSGRSLSALAVPSAATSTAPLAASTSATSVRYPELKIISSISSGL